MNVEYTYLGRKSLTVHAMYSASLAEGRVRGAGPLASKSFSVRNIKTALSRLLGSNRKQTRQNEIKRLRRIFEEEFEKILLEERVLEWLENSQCEKEEFFNHNSNDSESAVEREKDETGEANSNECVQDEPAKDSIPSAATTMTQDFFLNQYRNHHSIESGKQKQTSSQVNRNGLEGITPHLLAENAAELTSEEYLLNDSSERNLPDAFAQLWASLTSIDLNSGLDFLMPVCSQAAPQPSCFEKRTKKM